MRVLFSTPILLLLFLFTFVLKPPPTPATASERAVLRGKYLVDAAACSDCHTPWHVGANGPEPDPALTLSGHPQALVMPPAPELPEGPWLMQVAATNTAWAGPWGVSFTANLTPDEETGLGRWTEEEFLATIRNGRHQGRGRALLPPMPWPNIRLYTDEDLRAIFAYLRSLPAIRNRVPDPLPPAEAAGPGGLAGTGGQ